MLSIHDYNHLKLLYEQFFKMNIHIKELIKNQDWDSVDFAIQDKEALLRKIIFFLIRWIWKIEENVEVFSFLVFHEIWKKTWNEKGMGNN